MAENSEVTVKGPEGPGSLKIIHRKGDILENTLGRVGSIDTNVLLATPHSIIKRIPGSSVEELAEKFKNINWQGNVEVYLNHSPLFRQLKRLFSGDRRPNIFGRLLLGLPATILTWLPSKLGRLDFYNPFTEAVTTYHSHPKNPVQMHEIGHAIDFDRAKRPTLKVLSNLLFWPSILYHEWKASKIAMQHLDENERKTARKVLEPAFGSYVGGWLSPISRFAVPIGILAGHVKARLIPRNIFFNGRPVNVAAAA